MAVIQQKEQYITVPISLEHMDTAQQHTGYEISLEQSISYFMFRRYGVSAFIGKSTGDCMYIHRYNPKYVSNKILLPFDLVQLIKEARKQVFSTATELYTFILQRAKKIYHLSIPSAYLTFMKPEGTRDVLYYTKLCKLYKTNLTNFSWLTDNYVFKNPIVYQGFEYHSITNFAASLYVKEKLRKQWISDTLPIDVIKYITNSDTDKQPLPKNFYALMYKAYWYKMAKNKSLMDKLVSSFPSPLVVFGNSFVNPLVIDSDELIGENYAGKFLLDIRYKFTKSKAEWIYSQGNDLYQPKSLLEFVGS